MNWLYVAIGISAGLSPAVAYPLLALLVGGESMGLPLPGETALITAAILASNGHLWLPGVIVIAVASSVVGDNFGYLIGRRYGRNLLEHPRGPFKKHRVEILHRGDAFFARHGGKAVALGRFVTGVRVIVALLAGVNRLPWRVFALWNVTGAILWATAVGVSAYYVGNAIKHDLLLAGIVIGGLGIGAIVFGYVRKRRRDGTTAPESEGS
jgi:undecaprenyl-diphosphatase